MCFFFPIWGGKRSGPSAAELGGNCTTTSCIKLSEWNMNKIGSDPHLPPCSTHNAVCSTPLSSLHISLHLPILPFPYPPSTFHFVLYFPDYPCSSYFSSYFILSPSVPPLALVLLTNVSVPGLPLSLHSLAHFFSSPISPSSSSSSSVGSPFSSWQQMLQRDKMLESQRRRLSHEWQGGECLMSRVTGWLRSWSFRAGTSRVKSRSKSAPLA